MSRSFTSNNAEEIAEFCARSFSAPGAAFTADEMAAMRASLDMAQSALNELRGELAAARTRAESAEASERRWIALIKRREAQLEAIARIADPRAALLEAARAGDKDAIRQADALFGKTWRKP